MASSVGGGGKLEWGKYEMVLHEPKDLYMLCHHHVCFFLFVTDVIMYVTSGFPIIFSTYAGCLLFLTSWYYSTTKTPFPYFWICGMYINLCLKCFLYDSFPIIQPYFKRMLQVLLTVYLLTIYDRGPMLMGSF